MLYEDGLLYGLVLHSPMAILDCLQSGAAALGEIPGKYVGLSNLFRHTITSTFDLTSS